MTEDGKIKVPKTIDLLKEFYFLNIVVCMYILSVANVFV